METCNTFRVPLNLPYPTNIEGLNLSINCAPQFHHSGLVRAFLTGLQKSTLRQGLEVREN